ncbi:hypothetical protein TNCV_4484661 [Trichonephila clavipes]|nr:hypothetical protein TNCV_4484661 [Trichonephila clavipes]
MYCGCSELVGIATVGKLPESDTLRNGQIVGVRCMGHSISEIVRQLEFTKPTVSRVYQKYMNAGPKTSKQAKDKWP